MDLIALAARLHALMPGEIVDTVVDREPGWTPEPARCHDNAAFWVASRAGYRRIPGWVPAPYLTFDNRLRFLSHSVVEAPDGALVDVTLGARDLHRFIRHPGAEDEFYAAVRDNGLPSIDHVLGPDPEFDFGSAALEPFPNTGQF